MYNGSRPSKALRFFDAYLARDLGAAGVRADLVAAGPLRTRAASGIPGFVVLVYRWNREAPPTWDPTDACAVADAICFLLSDLVRAITGEALHVDGGVHAMATCLRDSSVEALGKT